MRIEGLTFCEALKFAYLGDRIWNTWEGESKSLRMDFYSPDVRNYLYGIIPSECYLEEYWSGETPVIPPGTLTRTTWCAETTDFSV